MGKGKRGREGRRGREGGREEREGGREGVAMEREGDTCMIHVRYAPKKLPVSVQLHS